MNQYIPTETPEEREALDAVAARHDLTPAWPPGFLTETEIKLRPKDQYGCLVFHPACKKSELFAQLAGTKTLTAHAIKLIMQLGYTVTYVQQSREFP